MMDGGRFRGQRPASRGMVNKAGGVPSRPLSTEPSQETVRSPEPVAAERVHTPSGSVSRSPRKRAKLVGLVVLALGLIAAAVVAWIFIPRGSNFESSIDESAYQAVFISNGQVYFGKLQTGTREYVSLVDVYYLQTEAGEADAENPQQASGDQGDVQLVKLGDEIHGPQDEMIISRDQILFIENLKAEGRVSQSIQQYQRSN